MSPAFDTPWKEWNAVCRLIAFPWIRTLFLLNNIPWGKEWRIFGVPIIQKHRNSEMQFGNGLSLRSSLRSNPLSPTHPVVLCTWRPGATIRVGLNFAMTGGSLVAAERIIIGDRVIIGANSFVIDTDFHPLDHEVRKLHPNDGRTAPVIIEDDVFIGMNSIILKGVVLGKGSVIGAGSVVTHNIPSGVIAVGNPARVIKNI